MIMLTWDLENCLQGHKGQRLKKISDLHYQSENYTEKWKMAVILEVIKN